MPYAPMPDFPVIYRFSLPLFAILCRFIARQRAAVSSVPQRKLITRCAAFCRMSPCCRRGDAPETPELRRQQPADTALAPSCRSRRRRRQRVVVIYGATHASMLHASTRSSRTPSRDVHAATRANGVRQTCLNRYHAATAAILFFWLLAELFLSRLFCFPTCPADARHALFQHADAFHICSVFMPPGCRRRYRPLIAHDVDLLFHFDTPAIDV